MSNVMKFALFLVTASIVCANGCGQKSQAPTTNPTQGPILAPPQQPAAQPTEGEPAGKAAADATPGTPTGTDQAAIPTEGEPTGEPAPGSTASQPAATDTPEMAKIKANLASLSSEDRAMAEKQKICPVSGEPLGSMGAPKKLNVAGRDVFICCEGCEESLVKEPAKYLAKIGLQPAQ